MIKYMVISGGLYYGYHEMGAIQCLIKNNYFSLKNIKKIYATSVGGMVGALLCTKIKLNTLVKYLTNTSWHKVVKFNHEQLFALYNDNGLYGEELFHAAIDKVLEAKGLSANITLKEFYDYSRIELILYTTELTDLRLDKISYVTHPDLELVKALYFTCAYPFIFKPGVYGDSVYIDGGVICNYPLEECLKNHDKDEILGIHLITKKDKVPETNNTNIIYYSMNLLSKFVEKVKKNKYPSIENELVILKNKISLKDAVNFIRKRRVRKKFIRTGAKYAKLFLSYRTKKTLKELL